MNKLEEKPFHKKETINILIVGLLSTIIPSILFGVLDGVIVALLLFFIFKIFLKKYDGVIFSLAFGLYLINSTFFLIITNYINGSPFLSGGDDLLFYLAGKQLYIADYDIRTELAGFPLWAANYPAYLYLISFYYGALSWIGFESLHFYHLTLLKVSLGSLIPVFIYRIGNRFSFGVSRMSLLVIILLPTFVIQTTSFLRESVISFLFIIGILIITSKKYGFYQVIFILILVSIIYFIRPIHAIFFIFFYITYMLLHKQNSFWVKACIITSIIVGFLIFSSLGYDDLFKQYDRIQSMYSELSLETNEEGSLGVLLYSSTSPFLLPIKLFYYYMSPIPPPIIGKVDLFTFYLSIGAVFWYLVIIGFLRTVFRKVNSGDSFFMSVYLLFIFVGIIGVSTSKDPRHLTFLYPLIIPFGLRELNLIPKIQLYLIFPVLGLLGLVGYILLKYIL